MRTLFRRSDPPKAKAELVATFDEAFQRRLESLVLVARRLTAGKERAERRSKKSGSGIEFAAHRPYFPGDDFRFVDWKVFGRSERLLIKQFEEEQDLSVYVLIDCSTSMTALNSKKLHYAKQLAAALGYVALSSLDRVSIQAFSASLGERLAPTRGRNRALTMLRFIAGLSAEGRTDMARSLKSFAARESRRGLALVITDGYDAQGFTAGIDALRYARFMPAVLCVVDDADVGGDVLGDVCLVDSETGDTRDLTVTPALLDKVRSVRAEHFSRLSSFCREKQVPFFQLSIAAPFDDAVLELLYRGGLLG